MLSCEQDPWFKQTMYLNFGDLGIKIKELVDDYQRKTQSNQNIETIGKLRISHKFLNINSIHYIKNFL